ncbi:hypothetical protein DWX08_04760 [Ruminococcus sp. AF18-22]|nr:hypothetical protein DWX08_04760 [Ruminococcus sp. AF18-22]
MEEKRCELDKVEILFKRKEEKEQAWQELKTIKGIRLLSLPQFNNIEVNDMENAVKEVKAASDYVTDSNEEEGAAKAIEKFVL